MVRNTALLFANYHGPEHYIYWKAIIANHILDNGESFRPRADRWANVSKNLLAAGANPDAADLAGWTALHHACNHAMFELIPVLLEGGANVSQCPSPKRKSRSPSARNQSPRPQSREATRQSRIY